MEACVLNRKLAWSIVFLLHFLLNLPTAFADAVSVPSEARDMIDNVKIAAQAILDAEQAALDRTRAQEYVREAEEAAAIAEHEVEEAAKTAEEAQDYALQLAADAKALEAEAKQAALAVAHLRAEADKTNAAAQQARASALRIEAAAKAKVQKITKAATEKLLAADALEDIRDFELIEIARRGEAAILQAEQAAGAEIDAVHVRADRLDAIAEAADIRADKADLIADQKADAADALVDKAEQALDAAIDAKEAAEDAKAVLADMIADSIEARKDLETLIFEQDHPKSVYYFSGEANYYYWSNGANSGHQFIQPLNFGYWSKETSFGASVSYVRSQNNTAGSSGSINTLTDMSLFAARRNDNAKFLVEYGIGVNVPTGKATLSLRQRNAMMNDDLVQKSQFGEGWNFTPSIVVNRKIGKEDLWTLGTSYAVRGRYDPTTFIANDRVSPGSEWRRFLRWRHAGQAWQLVGEISNTNTGVTKVANGDRFHVGGQWEYRLAYNRKLPQNQDLMYYYFYTHKSSDRLQLDDTKESPIHYLGTMWSKKLNDKHTIMGGIDVMRASGTRYDSTIYSFDDEGLVNSTTVYVDGRTKYTIGVGYDVKLNPQSSYFIGLQKFIMKDGVSSKGDPGKTVTGFNVLLRYNRSF